MKAVVQDTYGSPAVMQLREIERPVVTDDDVLVRVHAASVNPPDVAGLMGVPYIVRPHFGLRAPKIPTRGTDLAGTVESVGKNVTRVRAGDEVYGSGTGAFAEYALAPEARLAPKPAGLTFEQAAAAPMAGLTALQALRDVGHVRPGQKVLIVGAGGGIGTFAVQMAKAVGAHVTGVCSTAKVDLVRSLGADRVIDYTREDFTSGAERYDFILDNVLTHPLSELVHALTPKGMLVPNGGQFHKRWTASTGVILIRAPLLSLVVSQRIRHVSLKGTREELLGLTALLTSGKVTPVVGRTYPLSRAAEALAYFGEGHAEGKVVISL